MSDFDKEAEREKLREKYERDKEKRQSTQRMSELLLKGATMTSRHCEECGDPIFRYDGQEFCPTCQQAGHQEADSETAETTDTSVDANNASAGAAESAEAGAELGAETDAERSVEPRTEPSTEADTGGVDSGTPVESVDGAAAGHPSEPDAEAAEARSAVGDVGRGGTEAVEREGDLTAARASLIRSVERYARAAEQTDDPRRARDHLAAAHEAAETLNALDR